MVTSSSLRAFGRWWPLAPVLPLAIWLLVTAQRADAVGSCAVPGAVTWNAGAANNNWSNGANWSSGAVPTSTTHVCIQNPPPAPGFINIGNFNANAASVESDEPITIANGGSSSTPRPRTRRSRTSTDRDGQRSPAARWPSTARSTGSATARLGDATNASGQTVIANDGTLSISGAGNRFISAFHALRIDGTANWGGTADILAQGSTPANTSLIEVRDGGQLNATTNQTLTDNSFNGATPLLHVLAGGTFRKSAGLGETEIGIRLDNDGTVATDVGTLRTSRHVQNDAQMPVAAGATLELAQRRLRRRDRLQRRRDRRRQREPRPRRRHVAARRDGRQHAATQAARSPAARCPSTARSTGPATARTSATATNASARP